MPETLRRSGAQRECGHAPRPWRERGARKTDTSSGRFVLCVLCWCRRLSGVWWGL